MEQEGKHFYVSYFQLAKIYINNIILFLAGTSLPYPYGLDVFENNIYWTDWMNKSIEKANKLTGENRTVVVRNVPDAMGITIFHRNRKNIRTPCGNNNHGGCSHLCLLRPKGHSCACPTGIKLMVRF